MKIVKDGSYRKTGTGTLVFRYKVVGTPAELAAYKKAQGDFYRENEQKEPLFFSINNVGDTCELGISRAGKVFANTSEIDGIANMVAQHGGNLGVELAKAAAAKILGRGASVSSSTSVSENADLEKA